MVRNSLEQFNQRADAARGRADTDDDRFLLGLLGFGVAVVVADHGTHSISPHRGTLIPPTIVDNNTSIARGVNARTFARLRPAGTNLGRLSFRGWVQVAWRRREQSRHFGHRCV